MCIRDRASTLSGLDTISSQSKENMSIVMLKYDYGTDMNDAYDDLKKQMDLSKAELPDDADDPIMLERNTSIMPNEMCIRDMDCTSIGPGAVLDLPVRVPGALLAMGDLHAVMGDGEMCIRDRPLR